MLGSEQSLDLYKLFMVVKDKGGYDVVCKNRLWDLVGEEYGLGVKVGSSVELVYTKYLSSLETPLENVVDDEFPECDLVDDRVKFSERLMELQAEFLLDDYGKEDIGDELISGYKRRRKLCKNNRVKGVNQVLNVTGLERVHGYIYGRKLCGSNKVNDANLESNAVKNVQSGGKKLDIDNAAMDIMEEFDEGKILAMDVSDEVNNMPGLSDGSKSCGNDDDVNTDDVLILEPSSVNRERFGRKRKRGSISEIRNWVTITAKNPCDPMVGSMPEKSKWKSYGNQEIWKKVLLFREAAFLKKDFGSNCEKLSWLARRMHPSMYDDNLGENYNISSLEMPLKNVFNGEFPKCDLVDDRVKFSECLMELQAEFLLDDYGEKDIGDELISGYKRSRKLCKNNRVKGLNQELNATGLERVHGYIDGRKLCGFNKVNDAMDVSDEVNNMPGLSDGSKSCGNDDVNTDDVLILEPSSVNRESFGHKRKRGSISEIRNWVTITAKNPCDPVVGSMPEKSKWKSCGNQEIWKKVLLFREAAFLKKDFGSNCEKLSWLAQRMHPSMYDDNLGTNYKLRQRIKRDNGFLVGKSAAKRVFSGSQRTSSPDTENCAKKKLLDSYDSQSSLEAPATVNIPLGPNHQAEVPEWTGTSHKSDDSKWLGTQIWPLKTVKSNFLERDSIGKGRQDSCDCQIQGSVECVRLHIIEKRAKLKLELGVAFYLWNLHKVGEEVSRWWTPQEEQKFKDIVKSNPASLDRCFWDEIFKTFPKKSRENLVSYYFNVFLLQCRGYQNRHTPDNIDSDDEESEFTQLKGIFGHQTNKLHSITLLSPKKPHKKPHTKGE